MSTDSDVRTAFGAPPLSRRIGELRTAIQPLRLLGKAGELTNGRAEHPKTVVVVPGLGSGDGGVAPLRFYLSRLGHETPTWGLGTNGRNLIQTLPRFETRLEEITAVSGSQVALVGWSLGGVVSREMARDRSDLVSMVITYGSPLLGPRYTAASRLYSDHEHQLVDDFVSSRARSPIEVPVTAIYSKRDGVVDWRTCIDRTSPRVENIEVSSTHLGMGLDPDVWSVVADRLDRPEI